MQVSGSSRSQGRYSERSRPDGHLDPFVRFGRNGVVSEKLTHNFYTGQLWV